jgi:hypothetical protein
MSSPFEFAQGLEDPHLFLVQVRISSEMGEMVTDRQVRRLRMELGKRGSLLNATLRSGMSEKEALLC